MNASNVQYYICDVADLYAFWCPLISIISCDQLWPEWNQKQKHFLGSNYAENSIAQFRKVSRDIPNYFKNESEMFVSIYENEIDSRFTHFTEPPFYLTGYTVDLQHNPKDKMNYLSACQY